MPKRVLEFLEKGSFVCSITGSAMHSVALDEAHEMLVNKDLKTAVVRPTKEYVDRVLYYFSTRTHALRCLKQQLGIISSHASGSAYSILDPSPAAQRVEENIKSMMKKLESCLLSTVQQDLIIFSGKVATPEQSRDLLNFWDIGMSHFEARVKYFIIHDPSAAVPQRQNKLLTFSTSKRVQKNIKLREKKRKVVSKCIHRQMAFIAPVENIQAPTGEQYIELPSDPNGVPHKGQKSYTTKWLVKRYKDLAFDHLPLGWNPEAVILEGMFLINITPLDTHSTLKEYLKSCVSLCVTSPD